VSSTRKLIVAGVRLDREPVLALAGMLARDGSDRTARTLLDAVTKGRQFVTLTRDDKERVLAVLDHPPASLSALRGALFDELNWQRNGLTPPSRPGGIAGAIADPASEPGRVAWV
jgi:hypothetical protein